MSSVEKKIYAEITVPGNRSKESVNTKTTYRGMSTVNPENNSVSLYDISLIKQDLINHFHIRQGEKLNVLLRIFRLIFQRLYECDLTKMQDF